MKRHVKIDPEAILALIKSEGYKIGEFAEELNISYRTLKRYFDERRMPRETYHQTARILNVQCETLMHSPPRDQEGEEDLKRRDFIQLGIATTLTTATTGHTSDPDLWERLSKALKKPGRVDGTVISNLEQIKDHCYHLMPEIYGSASQDMTSYVKRHLDTTTTLLEGASTRYQKPLSSIAAELSIVIGRMNSALDETNKAQMALNMALECALSGNHTRLQVIIPIRMALFFIHQGQSFVALDYLRQARKAAEQVEITATTRSWLYAVHAEAQANMHNEKACLLSLEKAGLAQGHGKLGEDPYWTKFDNELYSAYKGTCYLKLNRLDDAKKAFLQSLQSGASLYRRASVFEDLADVCIKQSHIDEACKHTEQVIHIAQLTNVPVVIKQAQQLYQQLLPWQSITEVKQIEQQMNQHGFLN